jgi:hypothetical protein
VNAHHRDEAAAICLWRAADGEPITFNNVKAHIGSCPDCATADARHVWFIVTGWQRGIDGMRIRARR